LGLKNPNLGPIKNGPFIALRIVPGTLGTAAGLKTDAQARVLREDGSAVEGLYACGNDATSIMAGIYPGAGITIGPAIVSAFLAVEHATGKLKK
jgi:3-oxosteroid 1-dehydrogenase